MKVWLTGGSGMMGGALVPELERQGHDVRAPSRAEVDVTDQGAVRRAVESFGPERIVHCAAFTAVDRAESEPERARAVNVQATDRLAGLAARLGIHMTLVSTDYVFDGTATEPIPPAAPRRPLGVYGRTKADAEEALQASGADHLIVRTSWLFGAGGTNFVDTVLERLRAGRPLRVIDDQRGRPTWTVPLAGALADLVGAGATGIHHVACRGEASWFELATAVSGLCGHDADITPVPTTEYPAPAPRPAYSVLDLSATEAVLGRALPGWRESLRDYLDRTGRLADV